MDPLSVVVIAVVMVLGAAMSGASVSFNSDWLLFGALAAAAVGMVLVLTVGGGR